ncbi:XRE family transcriptional regulator, partial [Streptococcus suis]
EELDVDYKTLQRWERAGLRRYSPPIEDTRKVFYKIEDILIFLGAEK